MERKLTYKRVATRYWAYVASVVPFAWTAKAIRIAQAADALQIDHQHLSHPPIKPLKVPAHAIPAKKINNRYALCAHDIFSLHTIGTGNAKIIASATKSSPPIANVSSPYAKQFIDTVISQVLFLRLHSPMIVANATP